MGTLDTSVSLKAGRTKPVDWHDLGMGLPTDRRQEQVKDAANALKNGYLVAFPTETVYGLGADAINEIAIDRIYRVKGRPKNHPLIVHISSKNKLDSWVTNISNNALKLADAFWPGPMTLILKRSKMAQDFVTGGQETVGIRVPSHPIATSLLEEFEKIGGHGVAAPSANRFKAVSPTTAHAVHQEIGNRLNVNDLILDGGLCSIGIESTIIDCTKNIPNILRPGFITREQIISKLLIDVTEKTHNYSVKTSGLFDLHYSPKAEVILDESAKPGQGFLAMANIPTPDGAIRLNSPKTIEEYARILYESLRLADQKKLSKIIVITPPGNGIAAAIRDRLLKASGKRNLNDIS